MKSVVWTDERGWLRRSLIKESDPDSAAKRGVPAGPPDLTRLDWDAIQKEINNFLVQEKLFTWEDVVRSQNGISQSLSFLKRRIVELYRT